MARAPKTGRATAKDAKPKASGRTKAGAAKAGAAEAVKRTRSGGSRTFRGGRPVWTGQLRLSLVSLPARLYPATSSEAKIAFHQVHKPSGKRIRYEKVVPGVGPVEADDIIKGYEIESGRYVLLTEEEIDSVKVEARKTLELVQFVDHCEIDPIYFERPYYVVPDGELAEEAYQVLRDALRATGKMGLGQLVMRGREYIAAIKPCGQGLLLETLRFADEVRSAAPYFADLDDAEPDEELLGLAEELIKRKAKPFRPDAFRDSYVDALRAMIDAKAHHKRTVEVDEDAGAANHGAKVVSLVDALKRSVARSEQAKAEKATARGTGGRRKAS